MRPFHHTRACKCAGHAVHATSRTDYSVVAASLGVTYHPTATAMLGGGDGDAIDVLLVAVSILSFERVVRALPTALLASVGIVDIVQTAPARHPHCAAQRLLEIFGG